MDSKKTKGRKNPSSTPFVTTCAKTDPNGFENFAQKTLLHYHTGFNTESNIQIDHQDIFIDGTIAIEERGKRIKTLRKKAYKRLLYTLLEMEETREEDVYEAYEVLEEVGRVGVGALAPSDSMI